MKTVFVPASVALHLFSHYAPARAPGSFLRLPLVTLMLACAATIAAAAESGLVTGSVSNRTTGDRLEGAKVAVPQLGVSALTDNTGRFVLPDVPPGTYEVVASYVGLDSLRSQVSVGAGQRTTRDFDLTTGIY